MKTKLMIGAAIVVAAVPAVLGLWGNASFSQDLPVRVPASGEVVPLTPAPTITPSGVPSPAASVTPSADPSPAPSASVDDHGGDVPRDQRVEPGDDRRPDDGGGDDRGSGHGSDDHGSGHGSDDSGSSHGGDDGGSGHGGHGSDD